MGEFAPQPQPWVVLERRLHREQPVLPCSRGCSPDSIEGRVRCPDKGRSCNSGTVAGAAPQGDSACHNAGNALRLSEMLLYGREYCKPSFRTWVLAASTHCQTAPPQRPMRVPERFRWRGSTACNRWRHTRISRGCF